MNRVSQDRVTGSPAGDVVWGYRRRGCDVVVIPSVLVIGPDQEGVGPAFA
jgi:hypothetical protein